MIDVVPDPDLAVETTKFLLPESAVVLPVKTLKMPSENMATSKMSA